MTALEELMAVKVPEFMEHHNCHYCGSMKADDPPNWAAAIRGCNNCLLDIKMKGQWNGTGVASFQRIAKMFPKHSGIFERLAEEFGYGKTEDQ